MARRISANAPVMSGVRVSRRTGPDEVYLASMRGAGVVLNPRQVQELQRALGGTLRMPLGLSEAQLVGLLDRVSRALDSETREDVTETLDEVDEILAMRRPKAKKVAK